MNRAPVTCEAFDAAADDLALGQLAEPDRSRLLGHATTCDRCAASLAGLADTADRLLELAPSIDPPEGFESRVLARAGLPTSFGRQWRRVVVGAAAAVAVGLLALGVAVAGDGERPTVVATVLAARSGEPAGELTLDRDDGRMVLRIDGPADWPGTWRCELRTPSGDWVGAGEWTADDVVDHHWTTAVTPAGRRATAMRVLGDRGTVLFTAAID